MCILEDIPIPIITSVFTEKEESTEDIIHYKIRSVHRRHGNSEKCIWVISLQEEVDCFKFSADEKWLEDTKGWGLKVNSGGGLSQIGISDQQEVLKIAKFKDSNSTREWHGYPADYCRRKQDRPSIRILMDWKDRGLISKTKMDKIKQYKRCSL
jgi:hypothetical protein